MPTYKFKCDTHGEFEVTQAIKDVHTAPCAECGAICKPCTFGGTGFVFAGRYMNERKQGFPDNSAKLNKEVDEMAKEMEEIDAYVHKDVDKVTKQRAKKVSEEKRKNRSGRFREDPK